MLTLNSDGQPFSQAFSDAMAQPSVGYDCKLFSQGEEVPCSIMRLALTLGDAGEDSGAESGYLLGSVSSTRMSATLLDCPSDLTGAELEVRIGVDVGGSFEYATVAWATVTRARRSGGKLAVEAAGRVTSLLGNVQLGSRECDMAASDLAAAIAAASGVPCSLGAFASTSVPVHVMSYWTCRDALGSLAGALGGFAVEDGAGVAVHPIAGSATFSPPADAMTAFPQLAEDDFTVDGLVVAVPATIPLEDGTYPEDTLYTFGSGRIQVTDTRATAETAQALWGNVQGATWRPGTITLALLDPRVTPLDVASVDLDGTTALVPCRGIAATFDGGWFGTLTAPSAPSEADADAGPLEAKVEESALAAARATANATRAYDQAQLASRHASAAAAAAADAQQSADDAADAASVADGKAVAAGNAAAAAQAWAASANAYSTAALGQLGVVQDVVGVLDWASKHGTFAKTQDTAIQAGKVYFTYDGTDYAPVVDPDASRLADYYELSMSEAMNDFILAHLAVTARGLWVLPSGKGSASDEQHAAGYKLLLSTDGTYIYDGSGVQVAKYGGTGIDYASGYDWHVGGENAYIFYDASGGTLTLGGSSIVLGSGKPLSELVEESGMRGYTVEIAATATDTASGAVTLTATVRKDGTALTAAEVLRVGAVKWYRADTGARVGIGLTLSASSGVRYLARLEG